MNVTIATRYSSQKRDIAAFTALMEQFPVLLFRREERAIVADKNIVS
jgi:hypothetical protein